MGRPRKYQTEEERIAAIRESNRRWQKENPEKVKENQRKWREENPDLVKEYNKKACKKWYKANFEKVKEKTKSWQKDNYDKVKEYKSRWVEKNPDYKKQWKEENPDYQKKYYAKYQSTPIGRANHLASAYRKADKQYNRGECTITGEWIVDNIFTQSCFYCGETGWEIMGCDRIDNSLPHTPDNVVPCCEECNVKRGRKEFNQFIKSIKHE